MDGESSRSRWRRVAATALVAGMFTLLAWSKEADAFSSGLRTAVFVGLLAALVVALFLVDRSPRRGGRDDVVDPLAPHPGSTGDTGLVRRRGPRPFAEVPREQRLRFLGMCGCSFLLVLLMAPPIITIVGRGSASGGEIVFLAALLILAIGGPLFVWWRIRNPSQRVIRAERAVRDVPVGRRLLVPAVLVVGIGISQYTYHKLASLPALALVITYAVSVLLAVLYVGASEWARKPRRGAPPPPW